MTGGVIVSIAVCKMKGGIVTRKPRIFTDSTEGIPKTKPIASEFIRRSNNRPDCRLQNERGNSYTETTDFHRFHGRRGRRYTQIMRAEGPEGMPLVHPFGRVTRRVLERDAHDIKRCSRWANSNQPGRVTCS